MASMSSLGLLCNSAASQNTFKVTRRERLPLQVRFLLCDRLFLTCRRFHKRRRRPQLQEEGSPVGPPASQPVWKSTSARAGSVDR